MAQIKIKSYSGLIDGLKVNELPFEIEGTTFTKRVNCLHGLFKYSFRSGIKMHEIYFIKKVNDYVEMQIKLNSLLFAAGIEKTRYIQPVKTEKIYYTKRGVFKSKRFTKELYEIDLTAAYWSLAHRENLISEELYTEGLTLSKTIRLVSLGALAKRILLMKFDGQQYTDIKQAPLHIKSNVFFKVAQLTDFYLKSAFLMAGNDALFYWVDALFLRTEKQFKRASEYFENNGLQFKFYLIDEIKFAGRVVTVKSKDFAKKHKGEKEIRTFNFEK